MSPCTDLHTDTNRQSTLSPGQSPVRLTHPEHPTDWRQETAHDTCIPCNLLLDIKSSPFVCTRQHTAKQLADHSVCVCRRVCLRASTPKAPTPAKTCPTRPIKRDRGCSRQMCKVRGMHTPEQTPPGVGSPPANMQAALCVVQSTQASTSTCARRCKIVGEQNARTAPCVQRPARLQPSTCRAEHPQPRNACARPPDSTVSRHRVLQHSSPLHVAGPTGVAVRHAG